MDMYNMESLIPQLPICSGLQSRQLHADANFAEGGRALVSHVSAEKLVKIAAKVVSYGRYLTFQLAKVAVP